MQESQHAELLGWVDQRALHHDPTSSWNIGQQIEHVCMVTAAVCGPLEASTPPAPRARWTLNRLLVFTTGWIPRGRAKAPTRVHPADLAEAAHLQAVLERAVGDLQRIRALPQDAWFRHFVFDVLRRDETLKFLRIHTQHHLQIIRDIARRAPGAAS